MSCGHHGNDQPYGAPAPDLEVEDGEPSTTKTEDEFWQFLILQLLQSCNVYPAVYIVINFLLIAKGWMS